MTDKKLDKSLDFGRVRSSIKGVVTEGRHKGKSVEIVL